MKKTIITHFYNEEYLLPWWLNHHKKYFDHGILIDYRSTDRSRKIIEKICPTWEIIDTKNKWFDAVPVDEEINDIQTSLQGWRLVLTVTEFLFGNLSGLLNNEIKAKSYGIPILSFFDWDPQGWVSLDKPLWHSFKYAHKYFFGARKLHNYPLLYRSGRHYDPTPDIKDVWIFKYQNCISSKELLNRRLQIQHTISPDQQKTEAGWQHHNYGRGIDENILYEYHLRNGPFLQDYSELINNYYR